jgi:CubicO group peptidase (beta-lactamase class C family)
MRRPRLLCALLLGLTAVPAAAEGNAGKARAAATAAIDAYEAALRTEGVVGGAVAVIGPDGVVAERRFGLLDASGDRPVTSDTIFHWASVTKLFTSIAAMQLVERGLLRLDDPVVRYIPELRQVYGDIDGVTVAHLLSHSAGFRGASWPWNGDGAAERADWQPLEPTDWAQVAAMLPYTALEFAPGSRASYSNLGILLLGEIVARVSREPIEIQIEKNILRPLGMVGSFFDATPRHRERHRTHDFIVSDGHRKDQGNRLDSGATAANGGLNGTIADMTRFIRFLQGDSAAYPILKRDTLDTMLVPRFQIETSDRRTVSIGLGFFISDERDISGDTHRYIGHSGFQRGNRSAIYVAEDGCCAFVFAANSVTRGKGNTSASALRVALVDTVFPALRKKPE